MPIDIVGYSEAKSTALEASRRLYTVDLLTHVVVLDVEGFNDSAGTLYWQLHDAAAVPAAGAVPSYVIRVPAGQSFGWKPLGGYRVTAAGIWVSSTTPAVFTAGSASFWVLVKFLPLHVLSDLDG